MIVPPTTRAIVTTDFANMYTWQCSVSLGGYGLSGKLRHLWWCMAETDVCYVGENVMRYDVCDPFVLAVCHFNYLPFLWSTSDKNGHLVCFHNMNFVNCVVIDK